MVGLRMVQAGTKDPACSNSKAGELAIWETHKHPQILNWTAAARGLLFAKHPFDPGAAATPVPHR